MEIKVGDKVRVIDNGHVYSKYGEFMDTYKNENTKPWHVNMEINKGTLGEVVSINQHLDFEDDIIAIVNSGNCSFMIEVQGLELEKENGSWERGEYRTDISFEYTGRCKDMCFAMNVLDYDCRDEMDLLSIVCRDARGMILVNDTLSLDETIALRDTLEDIIDLHLEEKEEHKNNVMKMSLADIEEKLGYRIELI